jgi:orotidine-5'-phosphate decarboxylase
MAERAGEQVTVHEAREGVSFGTRVAAAVAATGPICAGIDPSSSLLTDWGLPDSGEGLLEFGLRCVDAFAGVVPVIKPQVAFFERMGAAGMAALESVIRRGRDAELVVIADAKRGDIGSTSAAYASAWLDPDSPLASDAMTAVAYMGLAALQPMIDLAGAYGNGVFVVARSSNPEGRALQQITGDDGRSVADGLLAEIAARNASAPGIIGAVVGATLQPSGFSLSELGGPILAPGVGTQGASAEDVAALFKGCPAGSVLPAVSRSVLAAGPDVGGLRRAVIEVRDAMAVALAG